MSSYIVTVQYVVEGESADEAEYRVLHNAGLARSADVVGVSRRVRATLGEKTE
jgi:hypothetical protein